jgi:hypothetical protein
MQPITVAPVTTVVSEIIADCLLDGWGIDDVNDIALQVVNAISPQADPKDPCKWTITLPSADGTLPDS